LVVEKLNAWRKTKRLPKRTKETIRQKLNRCGYSTKLDSDRYLNLEALAQALGITQTRLEKLTKDYSIDTIQTKPKAPRVFDMLKIKNWFSRYPGVVARCEPDLVWLTELLTTNWGALN
jgi:hypothetical protein